MTSRGRPASAATRAAVSVSVTTCSIWPAVRPSQARAKAARSKNLPPPTPVFASPFYSPARPSGL